MGEATPVASGVASGGVASGGVANGGVASGGVANGGVALSGARASRPVGDVEAAAVDGAQRVGVGLVTGAHIDKVLAV